MKNFLILLIVFNISIHIKAQGYQEEFKPDINTPVNLQNDFQLLYSPNPNHREIVLKSLELAVNSGFIDTVEISLQEIRDRLETGAYSEDFEAIPGIIGDHFPAPWDQGPEINFYGYYPFEKIPYGSYIDTLSGWYRGLNHGFDPVQGFKWPGAYATTVEWVNSPANSYIWSNAISLYDSGMKAEAYQCLGHILHLLADMSVPSHIKIVDHGVSVNSINAGTLIDPDLLDVIVDEYELALSGGLFLPTVIDIPNLYSDFHSALDSVKTVNIPFLPGWDDYFRELGEYTYNHPVADQYYLAPANNGDWGTALDENGLVVNPTQYGITPPLEISGRWAQITVKSTANSGGTILPENKMIELCNDLVPKAVEYGAGLLMYFYYKVTDVEIENTPVENFHLDQNYPNPFNPSTKISWQVPVGSHQTLKIYDALGNEVATLVDEYKSAGKYEVEFDASGLPSGIYFYQLQTEVYVETKKMILIK